MLQSRGWLRSVHDNVGVDGDGVVQFDMIHARGDALLRLGDSKTNFERGYGPVCKIHARRDAMSDFPLRPYKTNC